MFSISTIVVFTIIAAAIVAYAQYIFKKAVPKFKFNIQGLVGLLRNRQIIVGAIIYAVGLVFYLLALSSGSLSFIYPAFSSTFIFVILISHFKLKEKITPTRVGGIALIILGIALVSGII